MVEKYVKTRAEQILEHRTNNPPQASSTMVKSVSQYRRERLENELEQGMFRESSNFTPQIGEKKNYRKYIDENGLTSLGLAKSGGNGLSSLLKEANTSAGPFGATGSGADGGAGGYGGNSFRGHGGTVRQVGEVYSPLWLNSNLNLPRDRATINAWSRSFFALNPIVHNAITLHSTYPIAKLNIKCKNAKIEKFFAAMAEELDLVSVCSQVAQEFWVLGECFVYGELDDRTAKWSRLLIQNPDYITVKKSVIAGEPIISLRPDENLRRIVTSQRPADIQQRRQLDPAIIEHVRRGDNIPLNNFYVSHLARKISPYEIRGTGIIVPTFRGWMLWDRLKECKYVQADSMIQPLTVVKIGNEEFRPTAADLEQWRIIFEQAMNDKNFTIFTHNAMSVERIGYGQGIYDTSGDMAQCIKEGFIGLMVPSVIMDGSDTTYATGSVALDVLRQRYLQFRNMLSAWLKKKIFAPISKLNDFYEYVDGIKTLIVPEVDWNHMSLFDMSDYIQNLSTLATGEGPAKKVSQQTLYRSLGLDYEDEQRKIRYEDIQDEIRRREQLSLQNYSLGELRAMQAGQEIKEIKEPPLPGEASPYETPSGGDESGGGGLGLPNAPGMSPPPAPIGVGGPKMPSANPPPAGNSGVGPGGSKPPPPA